MKKRLAAFAVAAMVSMSAGFAAPAFAQASTIHDASAQYASTAAHFVDSFNELASCRVHAKTWNQVYEGERYYWCTRAVTDHGVMFELFYRLD